MDGGAGALKRRGGEIIGQEAMAKGPVPVSDAVVTTAGKLNAKHIINAVLMDQDLGTGTDTIRLITQASLQRAEELKIEIIILPALGTGVGCFFKEKMCRDND